MLKKLVKYGNSTALILDRAILELLNMGEGSTVKLTTDGKSLIITPAPETEKVAPVASTGMEALINVGREKQAALEADPVKKKLADEWAPGTEKFTQLMEILAPVTAKYMKEMHKLGSKEFLADVDTLAAQHHGDKTSEEFIKEYKTLRDKYVPNYREMMKEMRETYEKAGYPAELLAAGDWE